MKGIWGLVAAINRIKMILFKYSTLEQGLSTSDSWQIRAIVEWSIVELLAISLASTHWAPVAPKSDKYLETLPKSPDGKI